MNQPDEEEQMVVDGVVQKGVSFTTDLGTKVAVLGCPVDGEQRVAFSRGYGWTKTTRLVGTILREFNGRRLGDDR